MDKGNGRVMVTGASSGIGEALARVFAAQGHDLVLVARSADKLQQLAEELAGAHGVGVHPHPADLSARGAAARLARALQGQGQVVDILVNNAGVLQRGSFVDMAPADHQRMLQLNVAALTDMLAHFVPGMVARGRGRVLNVASIAAFLPVASLATYAATKAYVLSLSEALGEELRDSGVTVTALCPGVTDTSMVDAVKAQYEGLSLPGFIVGDADSVARTGYEACMKGDAVAVPGALNLATTLSSRAAPKWLVRRLTGLVARRTQ